MANDITKEHFIEIHGEVAWKTLCEPLVDSPEFAVFLKSLGGVISTIEGWVHRRLVREVLHLAGFHGRAMSSIKDASNKPPVQRVLYVNDDGDFTLYDATGAEALDDIALKVLKSRAEWQQWEHDEADLKEPETPTMPKEEIAKLKDGPVKKAAQNEWSHYEQEVKQIKKNRIANAELKRAFTEKNGRLALRILESHNEHGSSRDSVRLISIQPPPKEEK